MTLDQSIKPKTWLPKPGTINRLGKSKPLSLTKMKVTKIKFGITDSENYQAKRYDLEAVIEPWENYEESFKILRDMVCQLANVNPAKYRTVSERNSELQILIDEKRVQCADLKASNDALLLQLVGLRKTHKHISDFLIALREISKSANYRLIDSLIYARQSCEALIPYLPDPQEDSDRDQPVLQEEEDCVDF
jgi:hypothetical protein